MESVVSLSGLEFLFKGITVKHIEDLEVLTAVIMNITAF
jgi:hypothetical protein